jgi:hypothetical protein
MIKAEIASEMTRSRNQTDKTGKTRGGGGLGCPASGVVAGESGISGSGILLMIIRIECTPSRVALSRTNSGGPARLLPSADFGLQ